MKSGEGVLNPAAIRARDGQLYLFPRLVARGNFSRIGIARVLFDGSGDPTGVERMGMALEPEADYELSERGGGCEDPRIAYVEPLQHYVMTYTALSRRGPRIAIAISADLLQWRRIGLATFHPYNGTVFEDVDDKDASIFPALISWTPLADRAVALVHRPLFPARVRRRRSGNLRPVPHPDLDRESIWFSYCRMSAKSDAASSLHVRRSSPIGRPRGGMGATQNWRWRAADQVSPWLADNLSRRTRHSSTGH